MKLEEIIPEIHTLTTGVYYNELQRLVDHLITIPPSYRKRYRVVCREFIYNECVKVTDFFNIKLLKSDELPDNTLIVCINYHKWRQELFWE